MINHTLKDDILSISITNKDFSYRISLKKLGNRIDWKIGGKDSENIIIKSVSTWALQLFTKTITDAQYVKQFKDIVQEYCPNNAIHWEDTFMAVKIQNEYNALSKTNQNQNEIIAMLTEKYNLDY
ncbi:hypothetical protein [Fluviicola taffensis]|uniref:Uncharacterized protein n=1 Tax=Fluviicola taffensis (strain DSM 16823 / NCIMB 13979 / RW262) TaxID=755732 RepID=F2IFV0_FLUTR|nr:hypothetical protein [Fluviicola taffensis]AEA42558.1 hypothetical protein Fluta_0553 [Fluviicola taffensis DSM 16823]